MALSLLVLLSGCGSMAVAELPDPAGPPSANVAAGAPPVGTCGDQLATQWLAGETQLAVLCGRDRTVEIYDVDTGERVASASAGIGPTAMVTDGKDAAYVIDALGEALLVYRRSPFQLIRRVHVGGAPYAIEFDRERWELQVSLREGDQVVHYKAGWRPVLVRAK